LIDPPKVKGLYVKIAICSEIEGTMSPILATGFYNVSWTGLILFHFTVDRLRLLIGSLFEERYSKQRNWTANNTVRKAIANVAINNGMV
jgi:hypothetical protein